jgi:hypothetical protein
MRDFIGKTLPIRAIHGVLGKKSLVRKDEE